MIKNQLKVLRVTPSFASEEFHGSGLNAYYHTINSSIKNTIITEWKDATYLPVGNEVCIYTIDVPKIGLSPPKSKGLKVAWIFLRKIMSTVSFLRQAKATIKEYGPDVVHIYTPIHLLTGLYCKYVFRSKLVLSLHGTDVLRIKNSSILKNFIKLADHVFLLSKKMEHDLAVNMINMSYLGNGYDDSIYCFKPGDREKIILSVGNLRWQKDYQTLIKAFALFKLKNPDYKLVIVGEGELKNELINVANNEDISSSVIFKGSLPPEEVSTLMQRADIFALASVSEGSPKVIIEALASGLPVASTTVGDIEDLVRDCGTCCSPREPELLSKAMLQCVELTSVVNLKTIAASVQHKSWTSISKVLDTKYKELSRLG